MGYLSTRTYTNFENTSVSQLVFWLRLAQSITPTTGLAVHYQNRYLITGMDRFISGLSYGYTQESSLFDDPMSYEGHSLGLELTRLLLFEMSLKFGTYYTTKNYSAQGVYLNEEDYSENILREDKHKTAFLSLQKNLNLNFRDGSELIFHLDYQWTNNKSNSYWYDYSNQIYSAGIELQF